MVGGRRTRDRVLEDPLGAVQMGCSCESRAPRQAGPMPRQGTRETFAAWPMNDEETVALIAGAHLGKLMVLPGRRNMCATEGASLEEQVSDGRTRSAAAKRRHDHSGLEGAWTATGEWDNGTRELCGYEWVADEGSSRCETVGSKMQRPRPRAGCAQSSRSSPHDVTTDSSLKGTRLRAMKSASTKTRNKRELLRGGYK